MSTTTDTDMWPERNKKKIYSKPTREKKACPVEYAISIEQPLKIEECCSFIIKRMISTNGDYLYLVEILFLQMNL